jgi:hypothetical protein
MSDSLNEVNERPADFVKSYVDLGGATNSVLNGAKFFVLGPKGTGKTALAWYLRETEDRGTHLALVRDASSLPLCLFQRYPTFGPASRWDQRGLWWLGNLSYYAIT